jgi:two-component system cell cycle sensor histidine kinase/response regulator CckA
VLNLNHVIEHLSDMVERLIGEDIDLLIDLDPALGHVNVDAGQIEQVIMNLLVNGRDAMPQGGVLVIHTTNVDLGEAYAWDKPHDVKPGPYVILEVTDTGMGIDRETKSKIFEPFFTTKEKGKGTGLGLSTAYGIVRQSGGYIWVDSEPGRGATFKVYLPRADGPFVARSTKPLFRAQRPCSLQRTTRWFDKPL